MSMPVIVPGTGSRFQAITDIIESVALEQTAISHILNAEGEKIQLVLANATSVDEVIAVNASVESMVNTITALETVLKDKLGIFSQCICDQNG